MMLACFILPMLFAFCLSNPVYATGYDEVNVDALWDYLYDGDFIGFFFAILVFAFQVQDLAIGFISMIFLGALYLRTGSLLLLCIAWLLIGSFLISLMPGVSAVAILFMALGVAGLLYRLFRPSHG